MSNEIAVHAAAAAREKKAERLVLLNHNGASDLCDYQLICSGQNERQTRAIADEIEAMIAKDLNRKPLTVEGKGTGHWILLDYGDTFIHVFYDQIRDYYALENLWANATFESI